MVAMVTMKVLPKLPLGPHVVTPGKVAEHVLSDQEFIEIHLRGKVKREHIEEIRLRVDDGAVEQDIFGRRAARREVTAVELKWAAQRRVVKSSLASRGIKTRIVTGAGGSYDWS